MEKPGYKSGLDGVSAVLPQKVLHLHQLRKSKLDQSTEYIVHSY